MVRKIAVLVLATGMTMLAVTTAQAVQPTARIVAATLTPWTDAGTGQATFTASGLPRGTAYLQRFDAAKKSWQRLAALKKTGSRGTVTVTGLPQGINRFRVQSGSSASTSVYVPTYGVYTFDQFNKSHSFDGTVMPARDYNLVETTFKVPDGFGCARVDLGLEAIAKDAPNWSAEIAAQSAVQPAPVVAINSTNQLVTASAVSGAAVSGPIDIVLRAGTSNKQPFFAWAGMQVHCLADPGI